MCFCKRFNKGVERQNSTTNRKQDVFKGVTIYDCGNCLTNQKANSGVEEDCCQAIKDIYLSFKFTIYNGDAKSKYCHWHSAQKGVEGFFSNVESRKGN